MCTQCVTTAEVWVMSAAGLSVAFTRQLERWRDRSSGVSSATRRVRAWDENAAFLRSLGHDADAVLGPPPTPAAPRADGAPGRRARFQPAWT